MKTLIVVTATFCVFFLSTLTSQANEAPPNAPYIQRDICPFECCQYGKWIARTTVTAYKREGDRRSTAFKIKSGEEFTAIRGNVHIVKLGIVTVKKSFDAFTKGDRVYILSYRGEGVYDLWYKGRVFASVDDFWPNVRLISNPEMIWWVLVKNKFGKNGWLRLKNVSEGGFRLAEEIDGMDSCR